MAINTRAIYFYNANRQLTKRGSLTYNSGTDKYTYSASEPNINKDQIGTVQLAVALPLGTFSGGTPFMTVRTTKGYLTAPLVMSAASWDIIVDTVETKYQVFYLTLGIVSTTFVAGVNAFMVGYIGNGTFTPLDGSTYTVHDGVGVYEELDADKYEEIYTLIQANFVDLAGRLTQAESDITEKIPLDYLDTDGTLEANSDTKIATQKATKTIVNTKVGLTGDETIAGQKRFANTIRFDAPIDMREIIGMGGNRVTNMGAGVNSKDAVNFDQLETKIPLTYLDTDGTLVANSDVKIASQKATKTYADTKIPKTDIDTNVALGSSNTKVPSQNAVKVYADTALALKENKSEKGAISGYAPLDANQKLPLLYLYDSVLGQLEYAGVFDASTGSYPTETNALSPNRDIRKGDFFITSVDGTVSGVEYKVGDWAVRGASTWAKIDNTDAVASVNGKLGVVVLDGTDIKVGSGDTTTLQAKIVSIDEALANRYTKTQTYTKEEIEALVNAIVAIQGLDVTVLTPLTDGQSANLSQYDLVIAHCLAPNEDGQVATQAFTPAQIGLDEQVQFHVKFSTDYIFVGYLTKGSTEWDYVEVDGNDTVLRLTGIKFLDLEASNIDTAFTGTKHLDAEENVEDSLIALDTAIADIENGNTELPYDETRSLNEAIEDVEEDIETLQAQKQVLEADIRLLENEVKVLEETARKIANGDGEVVVSGEQVIHLGKDVADAQMKPTLNGITLQASQLLLNPNFVDTSNWSPSGGTLSASGGNLIVTGNGTSELVRAFQTVSIATLAEWYIITRARVKNSLSTNLSLGYFTNATVALQEQTNPTIDVWYTLSAIFTNSATITRLPQLNTVYANTTNATNAITEIDFAYAFNTSLLIANKTFSPLYNTTFDLLTANQRKAQMDLWASQGVLPNDNVQSESGNKRIRSVGKNLFDRSQYATSYAYKIKLKPSTQYVWNTSTAYKTYDSNLVELVSATGTTVTLGATARYIAFTGITALDTFQLEVGSTATAYKPYQSSEMYLQSNANRNRVPNGVRDTIEQRNGKAIAIKRVQEYTLQASDIYELTSGTFISRVRINTTNLVGNNMAVVDTNGTNAFTNKTTPRMNVTFDSVDNIWKHWNDINIFNISFPVGTYANLAAAQTALAGTKILYQLATPIETEIVSSGQLLGVSGGTILVENAVAFGSIYTDKLTITNTAVPIATLESIVKLNLDGTRTYLNPATAVVASGGLSFTHASLTSGDIVLITYFYASTNTLFGLTDITHYQSIEDLRFPATVLSQPASGRPDFDTTNIGLLFPQNNVNEAVYIIAQIPHKRVPDSPIWPHVHVRLTKAGQPVFKMDYKWYNANQEAIPASFTTYTMNVNTATWTTGTISNMIYGSAEISGVGKNDSSILIIKLYRDDNVYVGDILFDEFDIHYYATL
jgi:hypothetical protein